MSLKSDGIKKEESASSKDYKEKRNDQLIQFKIVYWGPGESGKTTNFYRLREKFGLTRINNGFSIETTDGRTLWQDSLFLSFDFTFAEQNYKIIVQVVTCTGQERFLSTREYVLDGADGIVFVGDSDIEKLEQNKRSFRELISFTNKKQIPFVIQLNKRDIENAIKMDTFKKQLGLPSDIQYPDGSLVVYPTNALKGDNIVPCFENLMIEVIYGYFREQI
ncbi:MAG: ATP/GTP-binding protein [Promethearchaeota archaeon]